MDTLYQFGISVSQWLQTFSPALDSFMELVTFLGTIEFYILLIPLIYWTVNPALGLRVLFLLISTDVFGSAFKQLLHQPRPYWIGDVQAISTETSYGIPSTHASNSLAIWGFLAQVVQKGWMWTIAVVLVLLIGISRMYLGVHFPQDVLGGWILGVAAILLFIKYENGAKNWWLRKTTSMQIALGFGISLIPMLIGLAVRALIVNAPDPREWAEFAVDARSPTHFFTLSGIWFGSLLGVALMRKSANFKVEGAGAVKLARYLLGMAILLAIYIGLDILFGMFAADESIAGYILRYVRYAGVAIWAIFGAPRLFIKTKLAESN